MPITANELFNKIKTYFPSCVVVWSNNSCNDINRAAISGTLISSSIGSHPINKNIQHIKDNEYKLNTRKDKNNSNNTMLSKNPILSHMLYLNAKTLNETQRSSIIRSPLYTKLEKKRDKQRQTIYKKYCGSSSYHYITYTHHYRHMHTHNTITSPLKLDNATNIAIEEALASQLARINII
jgi:hypothetical protein